MAASVGDPSKIWAIPWTLATELGLP